LVDAGVIVEQARLAWFIHHQDEIHADLYDGLADAIGADKAEFNKVTDSALGRCIILPSSYIGSEWYMNALYYDAIVIAACYGKPTFFIIFTANPQWPEIE
jgi:hypothetical protein